MTVTLTVIESDSYNDIYSDGDGDGDGDGDIDGEISTINQISQEIPAKNTKTNTKVQRWETINLSLNMWLRVHSSQTSLSCVAEEQTTRNLNAGVLQKSITS